MHQHGNQTAALQQAQKQEEQEEEEEEKEEEEGYSAVGRQGGTAGPSASTGETKRQPVIPANASSAVAQT